MHAASPRGRRAPCRPAAASPCHGRQKQVPWPMPRHSDRAHTSICGIGIAPISCSFHAALWRCMHVWALAAIASCGGGLHRPAVIGEYLFRALDTTPTAKSNSNCKRLKREKLPIINSLSSPSRAHPTRYGEVPTRPDQMSMHAGSVRARDNAVRTTASPVVADRRRQVLQTG